MPGPKGHEPFGEDEFIDADQVEFVHRGRQSSVSPELVAKLSRLPKGKAYAVKEMALDPNSPDYRTQKNNVSSKIRNACQQAGLDKISLRWSPAGVPQVINKA